MSNEGLVKTYTASATVNPRRIIKFGSGDRIAAQASATTDRFAGVAVLPVNTTCASGEPFDVAKSGIVDIDYGGTITRGDRLTTDSDGKAVSAETSSSQRRAVVAGGSAGNITVTGIATTDRLISVVYFPVSADTGTSATGNKVTDVQDLTSEFSITATNTINNTGGTATTGGKLMVIYERTLSIIGTAEVSGVSGDIGKVMIDIRR